MTTSTRKFHETAIRMLKGILKAWEEWLNES